MSLLTEWVVYRFACLLVFRLPSAPSSVHCGVWRVACAVCVSVPQPVRLSVRSLVAIALWHEIS